MFSLHDFSPILPSEDWIFTTLISPKHLLLSRSELRSETTTMPTNASLLVIFLVSICNLTADAQQGVVETCNSSSFFDVEVQIQPGAGDVMLECDQTQEARLQKVIKSVVDSKFAKYYQESMKLSALELVDHCPGASASGGLLDSTTAEVYATLSDCRFCLVAAGTYETMLRGESDCGSSSIYSSLVILTIPPLCRWCIASSSCCGWTLSIPKSITSTGRTKSTASPREETQPCTHQQDQWRFEVSMFDYYYYWCWQ